MFGRPVKKSQKSSLRQVQGKLDKGLLIDVLRFPSDSRRCGVNVKSNTDYYILCLFLSQNDYYADFFLNLIPAVLKPSNPSNAAPGTGTGSIGSIGSIGFTVIPMLSIANDSS